MGGAYKFDNTQASVDAYVSGPVQLFGRRQSCCSAAMSSAPRPSSTPAS
ncbi:hypothetical protein WJ972_12330 [Achromobacter insuavis]